MPRPSPPAKRARVDPPPKAAKEAKADYAAPKRATVGETPEGGVWPRCSLFFRHWKEDAAYHLTHDVLIERGWKYQGNPCSSDDFRELWYMADGKAKAPRRCLWLLEETEVKYLLGIAPRVMTTPIEGGAARHRINAFVGTTAAMFKTAFATAFRGKPWFPEAYALPDERKQMLTRLRSAAARDEYWVVKPKNDFGGKGCAVFPNGKALQKIVSAAYLDQERYVAQLYVARPLLIGGYKSHMRLYVCVTSLRPLRAYLYNEGHVMFATKPYALSPGTVGDNFDTRSHLTNYGINATEANLELFMKNKPVIGKGSCWTMARFLSHVRARGVPAARVWAEAARMSAAVARHVAAHSAVRRHQSRLDTGRHFELYGLDILMDETGKLWLLEGNADVGLEYCGSDVAGAANPDADICDGVTKTLVHDLYALLNFDQYTDKGKVDAWFKLSDD